MKKAVLYLSRCTKCHHDSRPPRPESCQHCGGTTFESIYRLGDKIIPARRFAINVPDGKMSEAEAKSKLIESAKAERLLTLDELEPIKQFNIELNAIVTTYRLDAWR